MTLLRAHNLRLFTLFRVFFSLILILYLLFNKCVCFYFVFPRRGLSHFYHNYILSKIFAVKRTQNYTKVLGKKNMAGEHNSL